MYHTLLVRIINGYSQRGKKIDDLINRGKSPLMRGSMNIVRQRLPLNIIHRYIGRCLIRFTWARYVDFMNLYDVGVMQRSNRLAFFGKSIEKIWIGLEVGVERFYDNIPALL